MLEEAKLEEAKPIKRVDALETKLETKYCIANWLRDAQIKMSCARFPDRIQLGKELITDPIALVCFGNSLNSTWEKIKDFKYVISCSGSHKFLRERGITPTYHVEVDPRSHKIKLIGDDISPETTFLMASCCHPEVFDHLEKHNAKIVLWHTYSGETADTLPTVYPRGEWVSTGGANVGLRAMVLARMLGFRNIHIFGMDGSFEPGGATHADTHPNSPKKYIIAEFEGKEYATTEAFLECARGTLHEMIQLPDIEPVFYGNGLIQDLIKSKLNGTERKSRSTIAFAVKPTISKEYVKLNTELHHSNPVYGVSVLGHLDVIKKLYEKIEGKSILDYGCGKGMLAKSLDFPIWEYDPCVPGKDSSPRPADLVVCVDVLEHIEPEFLDSVLCDIARCIKKAGYLVISTRPASKFLPDGRNTHLIQQDAIWWKGKLQDFFIIPEGGFKDNDFGLQFIVASKGGTSIANKFTINKEEYEHTQKA